MASTQYDALILVDPRFMGGTATAVETDVRALEAAGLDNTVIVCHQAPFKGDGALEYDPFLIQRQIRNQFGTLPT